MEPVSKYNLLPSHSGSGLFFLPILGHKLIPQQNLVAKFMVPEFFHHVSYLPIIVRDFLNTHGAGRECRVFDEAFVVNGKSSEVREDVGMNPDKCVVVQTAALLPDLWEEMNRRRLGDILQPFSNSFRSR